MPKSVNSLKNELYHELHNRGYDPVILDSKGNEQLDPDDADVIRFHIRDEVGGESSPLYASVEVKGKDSKPHLLVWHNNDHIKFPSWEEFVDNMQIWSTSNGLAWESKNTSKIKYDMQKRTAMKKKENLGEGYYPISKKMSYSDNVPAVKIILQHSRQLEEGEQRFRNVARIFVETTNGERFLLPTNRPGLARVYARHIAEGGTPYDDKAKHITSLVEEYTRMAGFVRATKNGQFNESTARLVNEGINHYQNLRETLTRLTTQRGYKKYFESYTPVLNEESDDDTTQLNELFVEETLDPRIESVLPILKRLSKNLNEMSEVVELAEWSASLLEGGDGAEVDGNVDGDTPGDAGEGGAEDVDEDIDQKKMASSKEIADILAKSLQGEEDLTSNDIYSAIDEYQDLLSDKGLVIDADKVAQILYGKLDIKLDEKMDSTTASLAVPASKMLEAPGAMTLKHNQNTEKANLKAFDLEEEVKVKYEVKLGTKPVGHFDGKFFTPYPRFKQIYKTGKIEGLPAGHTVDKERGPITDKDIGMADIGLEEGSGDAPIEKMSDMDLADYLNISVKQVKKDRKAAEQAARDKTDDVKEEEDPDLSNKNMAQQTAYMRKNAMPNDITFDKSELQGNKDAEKLFKSATNKDGTVSFSKGVATAVDKMQPTISDFGRTVGKFYYRDAPGATQKFKQQDPEGFKKAYDAASDADRAEIDKNLAITPKQAKANYKQYQADLDKQMTDQGYSKYGYNYNAEPVMGRVKNAGAWIKDKFNEEDKSIPKPTEKYEPGKAGKGSTPNVKKLPFDPSKDKGGIKTLPFDPSKKGGMKLLDSMEEDLSEGEKIYFHLVVDGVSKGKFTDMAKANEMMRAMKQEFPNKEISVERKQEFAERVTPGQDPNVNRLTGRPNTPYNDPAPELQPVKVQSQRPEGGQYSKDYLQKAASGDGGRYLMSKDKAQQYLDTYHKEDVEEDLDANQKRVGQLGPTEKVGPKGAVGKLVGANESVNSEDKLLLDRILKLAGK